MHIVTITSDWQDHDYYVASIKGNILSRCPEVRIVDISHHVKAFSSAQAAFLVRNTFRTFPEGTIHLIAVNTEGEEGEGILAAGMAGHYFVCADNGILGLLGDPGPDTVVRVGTGKDEPNSGISLFPEVACRLATGSSLKDIGKPTTEYSSQIPLRPTIEDGTITGSVIYVDSYQNAITNISRELFDRYGEGRPFQIYVQSKHYVINRINRRYRESAAGDLLAIFNMAGLLEIAICDGNAAGLLKLNTNSTIRIEFKNENDA